ncbi:MAG TPA: Xaa-Pro peptidase family protein [Solirubrobacteraceae bacterium]|nr:Xaa-Pro peptidase family protein [Solirubrobacteraceae bacterium]
MSPAPDLDARLQRVAQHLRERDLDALAVHALVDLRYLTAFTGSNGAALVRASGEGHRFFTDFRYSSQSAEQVPTAYQREIVAGELLDALAEALDGGGRLGFDETLTTVADHRRLTEHLPPEWELADAASVLAQLRRVKDAGEVEQMRAACALADEALQAVLERGLVRRTESAVALELEERMRGLGASAPSFPPIVACGAHGALPHAEPRDVEIPRDVLVTIDWGCVLGGYCSDCTRTYATGEAISARAREVYELVLAAQRAGVDAVRAGPSGREVDAVSRAVIEAAGEGEHFGHGLGHGVGMEIHEPPRLSRTASEDPLLAGDAVTVEPGVYLPGELGVRIEDLVIVREGGCDVLTSLPKDLTVVG